MLKKKCTYLQSLPLVKIQTNNNHSRNLLILTPSSELIIHTAQPRAMPPCPGKQQELEQVCSATSQSSSGQELPQKPSRGCFMHTAASQPSRAIIRFIPAFPSFHPWALVPPRCFLFREVSGRGIVAIPIPAEMETPCRETHLTTPWMNSPIYTMSHQSVARLVKILLRRSRIFHSFYSYRIPEQFGLKGTLKIIQPPLPCSENVTLNIWIFCSELHLHSDFSSCLKACDNRFWKTRMEVKHGATQGKLFALIFHPVNCTTSSCCSSWEQSQTLKSPNHLWNGLFILLVFLRTSVLCAL